MVNNAATPFSQQPVFDYYMFSTKVDQIINSKQRLSGSYSYAARPRLLISSSNVWSPQDSAGAAGRVVARERTTSASTPVSSGPVSMG